MANSFILPPPSPSESSSETLTLQNSVGTNILVYDGTESKTLKLIADTVGAVPNTRKVNNKTLNNDIKLSASDVGAEPAFTKNNAFNKNFGTAAGTVCQGNDSRLSNARRASNISMSTSGGNLYITYS